MGLYRRGKIYWASLTHNGKQLRFSTQCKDKKEAEAVYAKILLEFKMGNVSIIQTEKKEKITFNQFFVEQYLPFCKKQSSYNTKRYSLNMIPEWFKSTPLTDFNTRHLDLFVSELATTKKPATVNKLLHIVKHAFRKALDWELIDEATFKKIDKVKPLKGETKRLRYLNQEEIQRLLSHCDNYLYSIVFTALNTGMRRGEILNLKWENIDLKNGLILLEKTKNGERREIPMNESLKTLFRQLYTQRRLDTDYVFINPNTGTRLTEFKRSFATALKKAGIRDFTFHDLRHTFASQLVMAGVDLRTVQELLGHKTITMTLRYAHLSEAHKREAVKALENKLYHNFITISSEAK
ncbi:tyrosine-type recombinase/integrase [Thermodesulfovibrio yellowstonii]|uniref:tyrosine-type recombinase/integrase n=1 Tax=Thermodesulfovibrio yellowstonii TaxID=28262 RepID=UPI003C7E1C03